MDREAGGLVVLAVAAAGDGAGEVVAVLVVVEQRDRREFLRACVHCVGYA